ncbi:MAG: PqqD family peptide modification chaperone [Microbacterium sp.]|uniref:PqqD family peptide modification chaperone n=1 Tax=Microbacterium sp. TaxID=51671 RepID=UPI003F7E6E3D
MMRVAPRVGATVFAERVYLAHLPDGPIQVLEGTAALIWTHALAVPRAGLVGAVANDVEGDPVTIRSQVSAFVDALVQQHLLIDEEEDL